MALNLALAEALVSSNWPLTSRDGRNPGLSAQDKSRARPPVIRPWTARASTAVIISRAVATCSCPASDRCAAWHLNEHRLVP
jgi:hypothetical protein